MDEAALADRLVVLDGGKILTEGTPKEVFSKFELLKQHSLDVPQSTEFCSRIGIKNTVLTAESAVEEIMNIYGGGAK